MFLSYRAGTNPEPAPVPQWERARWEAGRCGSHPRARDRSDARERARCKGRGPCLPGDGEASAGAALASHAPRAQRPAAGPRVDCPAAADSARPQSLLCHYARRGHRNVRTGTRKGGSKGAVLHGALGRPRELYVGPGAPGSGSGAGHSADTQHRRSSEPDKERLAPLAEAVGEQLRQVAVGAAELDLWRAGRESAGE